MLESGQPLIVTLDVRRERKPQADRTEDRAARWRRRHAAAGLRVFVSEIEALPRLKSLIGREAGVAAGSPSSSTCEKRVEWRSRRLPRRPRIRAAVKSLPGIVDVHDI